MSCILDTLPGGVLRRILPLVLLTSLPAIASAQAIPIPGRVQSPPEATTALTREILQVSNTWHEALTRGDLASLDKLQTEDFLTVQDTGRGVAILARDRQKESVRPPTAERPKVERTLENVTLRQYGDVAVMTALATYRGQSAANRPAVGQAVVTEIWVRQDGAWRIAHYQPANIQSKPVPK